MFGEDLRQVSGLAKMRLTSLGEEEVHGGIDQTSGNTCWDQLDARDRSQRFEMSQTNEIHVPLLLDSQMTFASYVEFKFVPDHVEHKTNAGRTHYKAMLKHLLRPEVVNRIFGSDPRSKTILKSNPDWPYLDQVCLRDLTTAHVARIVAAAANRNYSTQTIKHIKNVIGAVISHAQKEGCFAGTNPALLVNAPRVKHKTSHGMTRRQMGLVLGMMQYPEREIALITIYTGLTLMEICELRWKDVNVRLSPCRVEGEELPATSILVRKEWNKRSVGDAKGGRAKSVEIPDALMPTLLDLKWRKVYTDANDFVLVSANGDRISAAAVGSRRLKAIGESLGMSRLSWQDFRRIHRKFALEFLLTPYSIWGGTGIRAAAIVPSNAA